MKTFLLLIIALTISVISKSQIKALTETGKEVLLLENGTWKYSTADSTDDNNTPDSIAINNKQFHKSPNATFLVKSNVFNIGVYIDPGKWAFSTHKDNEKNPEYRFSFKNDDGYAMIITEKTPISLDNMMEIALQNARKAAVDARIVHAEYRNVNEKRILCLQINGTIRGIKFTYFGYYYSNDNGTTQLICYSASQQQSEKLKNEYETFLNGLVEIR